MERLTHSFILFYTYTVGSQEVGVYDYNPPTLILKGNSGDNNTPVVLKYMQWPGTLIYVPENFLVSSNDSWTRHVPLRCV